MITCNPVWQSYRMQAMPLFVKNITIESACAMLSAPLLYTEGISAATLIRYACDEQLLLSVQNTLTADDATLNMAEINDAHLSILRRFQVQINDTENYRKLPRKLISERLPNVQFVKSLRKNEPDNLVLRTAVSNA